jgi:hypothetical protein
VTKRQQEILQEVARYWLMTSEALARTFYDGEEGSARKMLGRLVDEGLLHDVAQPINGRRFYGLSHRGTTAVGVSETMARPLGAQALRDRYGMLAFCSLHDHPGVDRPPRRLTHEELLLTRKELVLEKAIDPSRHHYYIDRSPGWPCLARAVVDHDATFERTARKSIELYERWSTHPLLKVLLPHYLALTVLTPTEKHQAEIEKLLDGWWERTSLERHLSDSDQPHFRIEVVPELSDVPVRRALDAAGGDEA